MSHTASQLIKDQAKKLLTKVLNDEDKPEKSSSKPPVNQGAPSSSQDHSLVQSLNELSLGIKHALHPHDATQPSASSSPNAKPASAGGRPSKSKKGSDDQCSGVTKAGQRCTRMVKIEDDDDESEERFCHQHSKELLGPSGFYARKNGEWVKFDDWIPDHLQPDTKVALRVEMEKARTPSDVPGYIYTFEIREPDNTKSVKLKVGRAVNLVKRIDEWGKQCGSKEQVLRGWYPGIDGGKAGSLMKGRVMGGKKAAWCHRLERLIHIELGDLVETSVHLDPAWPKPRPRNESKKSNGTNGSKRKACPDCGKMHQEIFEFQRYQKGKKKGKEWELVVKPVIERWGRLVDSYL